MVFRWSGLDLSVYEVIGSSFMLGYANGQLSICEKQNDFIEMILKHCSDQNIKLNGSKGNYRCRNFFKF